MSQKEKNGSRRGGDGGRDHGSYNDNAFSDQQQPHYGQPAGQSNATSQPQQADAAAADPYAIYGGYSNYLAMWYSSFQQQGQQPGQSGQAPPGA